MLVISNAMAKSASSVLFWYTVQLFRAAYGCNNQEKLRELTRAGALPGLGEFVYPLGARETETLRKLAETAGPIVVKTHHDLTPLLRSTITENGVKATFCHRDPRDMILSAMDHYRRSSASGKPEFKKFSSVTESVQGAKWWCEMACDWVQSGLACVFTYSAIVTNPKKELQRLRDYLGLPLEDSVLNQILATEQKTRKRGDRQFNQGSLLRFPTEMTESDQSECIRELENYITRLGYS